MVALSAKHAEASADYHPMAIDYPVMVTTAMATTTIMEAAIMTIAVEPPRQNAQPVEVRESVIMSKCSIPPESITVWEVEDVNGVMDQVK